MARGDITKEAVLDAMRECDRLGRDEFLHTHGFERARDYVIVHDGKEYDSKAIYAVAYDSLHPASAPIRESGSFSGGLARVVPELQELGFDVRGNNPAFSANASRTAGGRRAAAVKAAETRRSRLSGRPETEESVRVPVSGDDAAAHLADPGRRPARVWLVRGGREGREEPIALERGRAVIGWNQLGDLADVESERAMADLLQGSDPKYDAKATRTRHGGELWGFVREMGVGDLVVMPQLSRGGVVAIGEVAGAYEYRPDFPAHAKHTRPVRWLKTDIPREWLAGLGTELSYRGTVREVPIPNAEDVVRAALAGTPLEPSRGPRAWLFNANPKFYDIDGAVRSLSEMNWTVKQYAKQIHAGDAVYLWESGSKGGLIASGTILTEPQNMPAQEGEHFIRDPEKFAGEQLRVRLSIDRVLDRPLRREDLKEHPVLQDLMILKFANATNFEVTPEQNEALIELFEDGVELRRGVDYREPPLDSIAARLAEEGLRVPLQTLRRFHLSLKTRGFVILSGISGTGKTWLAELYASAVGARHKLVAVAPNWTTNEDLLGYLNPLTGQYQDTPFSVFLRDAAAEFAAAVRERRNPQPFHLLLDEMNLARVEYYFAKFLSAMEVRARQGTATLELAPGHEVQLTPNLCFVGTVNMDETTHAFADKVFDRAQLLELHVERSDLEAHLAGTEFGDTMLAVWDAVKDVAPFAFRVVDEMRSYVDAAGDMGVEWEDALDEQLVQKVLPKLKGAELGVQKALEDLLRIARERFPLSEQKASAMLDAYREHGFASYF